MSEVKWHKLHHHHRDEPNTEYMSKRRPHDKYMKSQRNRTMTLAFVCFLPSIHRYWVAGACLAAEHALNTYTRTHWHATQLPNGGLRAESDVPFNNERHHHNAAIKFIVNYVHTMLLLLFSLYFPNAYLYRDAVTTYRLSILKHLSLTKINHKNENRRSGKKSQNKRPKKRKYGQRPSA